MRRVQIDSLTYLLTYTVWYGKVQSAVRLIYTVWQLNVQFQLEAHLSECPKQVIDCPYHDAGCTFQVQYVVFLLCTATTD